MTGALPTLKCVVAWSERRNLCSLIGDRLRTLVPDSELRRLGDDAHVVCTALTPDQLRDALRDCLDDGEALFVAEFEKWSGYGKALDAEWLLRRGH